MVLGSADLPRGLVLVDVRSDGAGVVLSSCPNERGRWEAGLKRMVAAFSFVVSGLNFLVQAHPLCASTVCFPGASGDRFGAKEAATSSNQIDGKDM